MNNGSKFHYISIFTKRGFWAQVMWLLFLSGMTLLSILTSSVSLFVAAILISFLGLNETRRWAYKTNLILCAIFAVIGSIAGVFTWFEMTSIFLLLFLVGGFMLYYRETSMKLYPLASDFGRELSKSDDIAEIVESAVEYFTELIPNSEVFIALSDYKGGLYLPETPMEERLDLKRNGSLVWKTFASERSYLSNIVSVTQDKPLWCDANSIMSIPLTIGERKIGVLQFESNKINAFAEEYIAKLEIFAFILSHRLLACQSPVDLTEEE